MSNVWVVRAGRNATSIDAFLEHNIVAVGIADKLGEDALSDTREQLVERTAQAHPEWNKQKVSTDAGKLYRFASEVTVGDDVATYDPTARRYVLGRIKSDVRYDPSLIEDLPCVRNVTWDRRVARDSLSVNARNSLGAIQTIFRLNEETSAELLGAAVPLDAPDDTEPSQPASDTQQDTTVRDLRAEVVEKSEQFIEDLLASLEPYEMQDLVAGVLRAMGYKTRVSPKGADRGVDIFASPDGLGLQEPRIFLEVKHKKNTPIGSQDVRAFLGGRQPRDRCLYVSTGGFTKDARYEAERSNVPLTLLALPELRELVVEHYEAMDVETRRLVPLTKVLWPVADS